MTREPLKIRLKHERLAEKLSRRPLSQNSWARILGLTSSHLSMMVRGLRPYPGEKTRRKLLEGLDLEFEELFEVARPTGPPERDSDEAGRGGPETWRLAQVRTGRLRLTVDWSQTPITDKERPMQSWIQDLKYALRGLRHSPSFVLFSILTLGLAVGAVTTLFTLVRGVLLVDLPYPESQQVVSVWQGPKREAVSPLNFTDWRERSRVFESMAAYASGTFNLTGGDRPERVEGLAVTPEFLHVLGVKLAAGSDFGPEHAVPGSGGGAILSHALWANYYQSDPSLVGRTIVADGQNVTVRGVLPETFDFPELPARHLLVPLAFTADQLDPSQRGAVWLGVVGRIQPGRSVEDARSDMDRVTHELTAELSPRSPYQFGVFPIFEDFVGEVRGPLYLLQASGSLILLIACANLAGLIVVRSVRRRPELAIRTAFGAGRFRLIRQQWMESLLIALGAGVAALLASHWGIELLLYLAPEDLPRTREVGLDFVVLLFALGVSVACSLLFGAIPLLTRSRANLQDALRDGGRSLRASAAGMRGSGLLVVVEVGLAVTVLVTAGLLLRSFQNLTSVDPGFSPLSAMSFRVSVSAATYGEGQKVEQFFERLRGRLGLIPSVRSVGGAMSLPLTASGDAYTTFSVEGNPPRENPEELTARLRPVTPGYFDAMGIPLLRGRDFGPQDRPDSDGAILINQAMAEAYWPGENPIGKRIRPHAGLVERGRWGTVVGVVGSVHHYALDRPPVPEMYIPHSQSPVPSMTMVLRSAQEGALSPVTIQKAVKDLDPEIPIYDLRSLEGVRAGALAPARFRSLLLSVFASAAVLLAAFGLYGLMAYLVTSRFQEIGIRMAVGATGSKIMSLILRRGLLLTAGGLVLGMAGHLAVSAVLSGFLFGVEAMDRLTIVLAVSTVALATLAACWVPARRAARVDPLEALRRD